MFFSVLSGFNDCDNNPCALIYLWHAAHIIAMSSLPVSMVHLGTGYASAKAMLPSANLADGVEGVEDVLANFKIL